MPLRLGAMLMLTLLLAGCLDSLRFSAGRSSAAPPSDDFFEERGEADVQPNPPSVEEGGGEESPE
jgi:hypothetical protein